MIALGMWTRDYSYTNHGRISFSSSKSPLSMLTLLYDGRLKTYSLTWTKPNARCLIALHSQLFARLENTFTGPKLKLKWSKLKPQNKPSPNKLALHFISSPFIINIKCLYKSCCGKSTTFRNLSHFSFELNHWQNCFVFILNRNFMDEIKKMFRANRMENNEDKLLSLRRSWKWNFIFLKNIFVV